MSHSNYENSFSDSDTNIHLTNVAMCLEWANEWQCSSNDNSHFFCISFWNAFCSNGMWIESQCVRGVNSKLLECIVISAVKWTRKRLATYKYAGCRRTHTHPNPKGLTFKINKQSTPQKSMCSQRSEMNEHISHFKCISFLLFEKKNTRRFKNGQEKRCGPIEWL